MKTELAAVMLSGKRDIPMFRATTSGTIASRSENGMRATKNVIMKLVMTRALSKKGTIPKARYASIQKVATSAKVRKKKESAIAISSMLFMA